MSKTIVAFGEVLWDLLPDGRTLGGAPFNFINRVSELGHNGIIVSALGEDVLGNEALRTVNEFGLQSKFIQRTKNHPTGIVQVLFDDNQQPDYEIIKNVAYDYIRFVTGLEALTKTVDCIYYGTLAQRAEISRETLSTFINEVDTGHQPIKFLDVNLRKDCYTMDTIVNSLKRANILKLNEEEAHEMALILDLTGSSLKEIAHQLVREYSLNHCIITLGKYGAFCLSEDGNSVYDPGYQVDMIDPCGSGDAFSAGFIHKLFEERTAEEGIWLGNILGAIVASQRGATAPVSKENITHFLKNTDDRSYHPDFKSFPTKQKQYIS